MLDLNELAGGIRAYILYSCSQDGRKILQITSPPEQYVGDRGAPWRFRIAKHLSFRYLRSQALLTAISFFFSNYISRTGGHQGYM